MPDIHTMLKSDNKQPEFSDPTGEGYESYMGTRETFRNDVSPLYDQNEEDPRIFNPNNNIQGSQRKSKPVMPHTLRTEGKRNQREYDSREYSSVQKNSNPSTMHAYPVESDQTHYMPEKDRRHQMEMRDTTNMFQP